MMKPTVSLAGILLISGLTLPLLASPVLAFPFPIQNPIQNPVSNPHQQGIESAIKKIDSDLTHWEQKLANPDPLAVFKSYNDMTLDDVRRKVLQPFFPEVKQHPQYQALRTRLFTLRTQVAKRGVNPYRWQDWEFDGQQPTPDLSKYFEGIEMRLNKFYANLGPTNGYNPKIMADMAELNGILAKPEFSSNAVLKVYKESYVADQLTGIKTMLQYKRVGYVQSQYIDIQNRLKNMTKGSQVQLQQIKEFSKQAMGVLDEFKANGGQMGQAKISLNPRDPLAGELTLEQVRVALQKILAMK